MDLWTIETTGKRGVVHYAPEGTTEPLCQTSPASEWRTPPKRMRGDRPCANCAALAERDRLPAPLVLRGL